MRFGDKNLSFAQNLVFSRCSKINIMLVNTYNQKGENVGQTRLPSEVFGVKMNQDLVYQVAIAQGANRRQGTAHAKGRGDVRGGGRKPWRQKGTGRARHGSRRSPIWKGGGVTFGPTKERNYKKKVNKKARRLALLMVLSEKAKNDQLVVMDDLKLEKPKTKLFTEILKALPSAGKKALIALPGAEKNLVLAARNITGIATMEAKDLNCLDLLSVKYLILPKESIKVIKETFVNKEASNS